jgi:hypothetical protein
MNSVTWDIGILAALGLLLAYTLLIRKHKALATLMSVYVAYFVAASWGGRLAELFSGDRVLFNQVWIKGEITPFIAQAALLVIFTFVISAFLKLGGSRSRYSMLEVIAYAVCTVAVAVMFLTLFMAAEQRESVFEQSRLLPWAYLWRDWILMVPVFVIIYFGIYGDDDKI